MWTKTQEEWRRVQRSRYLNTLPLVAVPGIPVQLQDTVRAQPCRTDPAEKALARELVVPGIPVQPFLALRLLWWKLSPMTKYKGH